MCTQNPIIFLMWNDSKIKFDGVGVFRDDSIKNHFLEAIKEIQQRKPSENDSIIIDSIIFGK